MTDRTDHYENFPTGSWIVPKTQRPKIHAIYNFARFADDVADEGLASKTQRVACLASLKESLTSPALSPAGAHAIMQNLHDKVINGSSDDFKPYLEQLIDAFIQDSNNSAAQDQAANFMFATEAELLDYCARSANPIGRMMLLLFGCHRSELFRDSDAICSGLQWINFMQDVAQDAQKGRIYVPHNFVDPSQLTASLPSKASTIILEQTKKARALLASGAPLIRYVPMRLSLELRAIIAGGLTLADKIIAIQGNTQEIRPTLGPLDVPALALRMLRLR
jgi:hydroxysqualene synthase